MATVDRTALIVTDDADLMQEILRPVTACELAVDVAAPGQGLAGAWARADAVVVGSDLAPAVTAVGVPRRRSVLLATAGEVGEPDWRCAVELGADAVVRLPGEEEVAIRHLSAATALPPAGKVLAVVGARGGAGASVLATAIALAAARSAEPYLLDLDPIGCGIARLFGGPAPGGLVWPEVSAGAGRILPATLHAAVPAQHGVRVLGWGDDVVAPAGGVVTAVVDAIRRCSPLCVVDPGRVFGDPQREVLAASDRVLLLVPADNRSVWAAQRLLRSAELAGAPLALIVRGPNPGGLAAEDVVDALGVQPIGVFGQERGLDRHLESGRPPGSTRRSPLMRAALTLAREMSA